MNFKKIAAVMAALMLVSSCPIALSNDSCTLGIECYAAETILSAPINIVAKVKDNTLPLSWDKVKGADAYRIYKYDADKKKYVKYKSITGNNTVIKDLEEGTSYKFKIAALTKNGKSYKAGKASKTVTVSVGKADNTEKTKTEFKEVTLSAKEMAGAWDFYDFRHLTDISKSNTYNPTKKEYTLRDRWMTTLQFVTEKNVIIGYDILANFYDYLEFNASSKKIDNTSYKIYTDGKDYYLFLSYENGDGKNTYVFKKKTLPNFERVSDVKLLSGYWTAVDFCPCELNKNITYDPTSPLLPWDLFLTSANVTGKEITFYFSDGGQDTHKITTNKVGEAKYFVYSAGDDMYMYYQWISGDGDKQFYVLKKDK